MIYVPITSVSQLVKYVEEIKKEEENNDNHADLLFRGQPCDEPLLPKLGRVNIRSRSRNVAKIEKLLLQEFGRTSIAFSNLPPSRQWDLIALAQHHGLSTRLLDWTYSALAGLWFAVREPFNMQKKNKNEKCGALWVLRSSTDDFYQYDDTEGTSPLDNKRRTLIYRPAVITQRIAAQSGVFTVHKLIDGKRFVAIEKNKNYKDRLTKFVIPSESFSSIRKHLNIFNVNNALMFPDLDGLCTHLTWRYTKYKDEKHEYSTFNKSLKRDTAKSRRTL
ncbi:MAG: FRG domain-containing protein [Smithella sp.]